MSANARTPGATPQESRPTTELALKQEEFERLLGLQSERRQKEDAARVAEQKFEVREESLIREAYRLAMAKAGFHAEKISWKRALEDDVRAEEDTRRAMEDARRAIEDDRRKKEDQAQMELDADVKICYERNAMAERLDMERRRRWIEEDRVRALEDVLISQDVLDLRIHAGLRQHVRKHFNSIIGYKEATKQQVDAQVDALLDKLFDDESSSAESASGAAEGRSKEGENVNPGPNTAVIEHSKRKEVVSDHNHENGDFNHFAPPEAHLPQSPLSFKEKEIRQALPQHHPLDAPPRYASVVQSQTSNVSRSSSHPGTPSHHATQARRNIEVDDFSFLEEEENISSKHHRALLPPSMKGTPVNTPPRHEAQRTASSSIQSASSSDSTHSQHGSSAMPSSVVVPDGPQNPKNALSSSMEQDDDPDFAFDMSINSSGALASQDDWEVVSGGQAGAGGANAADSGGSDFRKAQGPAVEGATRPLSTTFLALRSENMEKLKPLRDRQMTKIMSENALKTLLDPSISDLIPFSKIVISTRDTWDSCEQCGTYFDRMSIKQKCETCNKNFCSNCGLISRRLDLAILESRVPANAQELRSLFPKTKEAYNMEVKCCNACDKSLTFAASVDAHASNQRASFFERQYNKAVASKLALSQAIANFDAYSRDKKAKHSPAEIHELENAILSAMRKLQASVDSIDQTTATLRSELPVNPKTNVKLQSSTEIRTLLSLKTGLLNFQVECKQAYTHIKIRLVGPAEASGKITLENLQQGHPKHR